MTTQTLSSPALSIAPTPVAAGRAQWLHEAAKGQVYTVRQVRPDPQAPERARQLEEIGFCPGERVMIMTRGIPGGDPLVVRVGQSTFALRGAEAACVQVEGLVRSA